MIEILKEGARNRARLNREEGNAPSSRPCRRHEASAIECTLDYNERCYQRKMDLHRGTREVVTMKDKIHAKRNPLMKTKFADVAESNDGMKNAADDHEEDETCKKPVCEQMEHATTQLKEWRHK